ncbi:aurora kinase A and ninein-interacting protein [Spea bombifrons]|uniref:aurora kinase A and ninein-interacting protein n=1 Tax=Spea bombifrons TaxID=233779 RepID=UPI00234A3DA2|nr:aurora kinase A and ninein-interacting protein [Spea bombifrons]
MKLKGKSSRVLQPEECGVWLDTSELKRRPQQMVIPCASSKRFNPIARKNASNAFVFDFTQTRIVQPCTKQTSMYSFFTPAGKKHMLQTDSPTAINENAPPESTNQELNQLESLTQESLGSPKVLNCTGSIVQNTHYSEDSGSNVFTARATERNSMLQNSASSQISPSCFRTHEDLENSMVSWKPNGEFVFSSSISSLCSKEYKEQDSLSQSLSVGQLFTQDSQGYKVISHRSVCDQRRKCHTSLPLQDRTNIACDITSPPTISQSLCDEDSLQRIFTQDSEGNLVIKH